MKKQSAHLFLVLSVLFFVSCGKKGPISPPLPKVPMSVQNLKIVQRGARIFFRWQNPTAFLDGNPLDEVMEVEIWYLEREATPVEIPVSQRDFDDVATELISIGKAEFENYACAMVQDTPVYEYVYELSREQLEERFYFGFRVIDNKNRTSPFVGISKIEPETLPLPPQNVRFDLFLDRIEIQWLPPRANIDDSYPVKAVGYIVFRKEKKPVEEGGEQDIPSYMDEFVPLNDELIKENRYVDKEIELGSTYHYIIRASATDKAPYKQSDDSMEVVVEAKDTFPPKPPTGLVSITGRNLIGLSWDVNPETDILGYKVYRKAEGEEDFTLLTPEPIPENAYNDDTVEKNKRYHYAISAVDESENESEKSDPISELLR